MNFLKNFCGLIVNTINEDLELSKSDESDDVSDEYFKNFLWI